jgi:cell division protein ZipA
MEADILRLILFLAGLALILGIYLADRYKREKFREDASQPYQDDTSPEPPQRVTGRREPLWTPQEPTPQPPERLEPEQLEPEQLEPPEPEAEETEPAEPEPEMAASVTQEPEEAVFEDPIEKAVADWDLEQLGEIIQQEKSKKREPRREGEQFSFSFLGSPDTPEKQEAEQEKPPLPTKLVQITIVPRQGQFMGQELLYAISETGLRFGDMSIYHFPGNETPGSEPLFSMANMVEPGSFDPDNMDGFFTPGLVLFAMLPGPKDGLTTFSEMLHTAERLATLLDGELKDDSHSDLSKQTIEHMREEIQEFHRKLQLAKSAR